MGSSPADDYSLDEWKEARSILSRYDQNLHDLRKYGFTFITALLAANGLLSQGSTAYTPFIKATVLITTLGLIVALRLLDKNYRQFQSAASLRAKMLESRLNLDITWDLALYYSLEKWWRSVQRLYYAFVGLTVLVGIATLWPNVLLVLVVAVAALVSYELIRRIDQVRHTAVMDWSVDRKLVRAGDPVRITFTNLDSDDDPGKSKPGEFTLSWRVLSEDKPDGTLVPNIGDQTTGSFFYLGDRNWLWRTSGLNPGLYRLEMSATRVSGAKSPDVAQKHDVKTTIQINPATPP